MQLRVLAFVLAGGKGTRLYPLTKERAKPAVPFGGRYRIVDFVLSNLLNSGVYSIYVLIQFKSQSLLQHLREGWEVSGLLRNNFIIPVPAQMRSQHEDWYRGTADAIHQNINLIEQADPHVVVIFGADHIYRMNIRQMIEYHVEKRAQALRLRQFPSKRICIGVWCHRNNGRRPHYRFSREKSGCAHHARRPDARVRLHGKLCVLDGPAVARALCGRGELK